MNSLKNNVQLIGRLGNNPEIINFDSGKRKATFSLATNDRYKDAEGNSVEETHWHNIVAWGKKVDVIEQYLSKGSEVAVSGKLINRNYEVDGQKRYVTEINVKELLMMGNKQSG
ncbi:MAG: single-stranded DNA-binding protein [Cyclobacteriaceae bacterium]